MVCVWRRSHGVVCTVTTVRRACRELIYIRAIDDMTHTVGVVKAAIVVGRVASHRVRNASHVMLLGTTEVGERDDKQ